jgi:hypothetical protein
MPNDLPWIVHNDGSDTLKIRLDFGPDELGPIVALVPKSSYESAANARLIVAARALRASLHSILFPEPQTKGE